jgi:hypothetical protein
MNISINSLEIDNIKDISLFICAIGFEERSIYQLEKLFNDSLIDKQKILCFYFSDFTNEVSKKNNKKIKEFGVNLIDVSKKDHLTVIKEILNNISFIQNNSSEISIHVDFSSMPRNWYCNIFIELSKVLRNSDKLFFWYSHGDYTTDLKHCSTAGTDDFVVFSGKASTIPRKRSHIMSLGFDRIKSYAIRTIVDPTTLIVCYAYPKNDPKIGETIRDGHKYLFDSAALIFSLPLNDFSFMVKKIREIVTDMYDQGDVILIPDGPKPLILACSIIPNLINKIGIVAIHVQSHNNFSPENIKPSGEISGFCVKKKEDGKL